MNNTIPIEATNLECFCIKNDEAYIGFKIPNGNFEFIQIPYTGQPKSDFDFLSDPIYHQQKKEIFELNSNEC